MHDASEISEDTHWMGEALEQARYGYASGEVPVGAVLVHGCRVSAAAYNRTITDCDPSAHAEILVLREAARSLGNHRLGGILYVTLEPCVMCMGALIQARIERLVYAADDSKAGAARSLYQLADDARLNHRFPVTAGIGADESVGLLRGFFSARRDS